MFTVQTQRSQVHIQTPTHAGLWGKGIYYSVLKAPHGPEGQGEQGGGGGWEWGWGGWLNSKWSDSRGCSCVSPCRRIRLSLCPPLCPSSLSFCLPVSVSVSLFLFLCLPFSACPASLLQCH